MYIRKSKPEKTRLPFSPPEAVLLLIFWRNEKAQPKNFNAVSHNHVRS